MRRKPCVVLAALLHQKCEKAKHTTELSQANQVKKVSYFFFIFKIVQATKTIQSCTIQSRVQIIHSAMSHNFTHVPPKPYPGLDHTNLKVTFRFPFEIPATRLLKLDNDRLVLCVIGQGSLAELATNTRLLVSTERYLPVTNVLAKNRQR